MQSYYVLCLNSHSSRQGKDWSEFCIDYKREVMQSPANTSDFLQPFDNEVTKKQYRFRTIRDEICLHNGREIRTSQDYDGRQGLGICCDT